MEQKKILWIVLAVSVFMLIIFGTAYLMYSPSRGAEASLQQAAAVVPAQNTTRQGTIIDPDSWVRDPETKPGLDSPLESGTGGVNLTIVNRNESNTNYGELDVTGLTRSQRTDTTDTAISPEIIPGQTSRTSDSSTAATEKTSSATAKKPVQTTQVSARTAPARKTEQAAPAKKPAKKTVIVTDYWIQAGSYSSKLNAERARETLTDRYLNAEIFTRGTGDSTTYRVRVGPYKSKAEADYWLGTVKAIKDFPDSYVSQVKTRK